MYINDITTVYPQVTAQEFAATFKLGLTFFIQVGNGIPSSLANANNCRLVLAKQDVAIMKTRINIIAVMACAPAVEREFDRIHTKGKASPTAVSTSVMPKRKTRSIAKAMGMLNM
jgi:hypothetical protein